MSAPKPRFFRNAEALRKWLATNHDRKTELWVGMYKKSSGKPSITWPEVVDQALCFGWIDGIRKSIDEVSYMNRITPRRPGSNWSAVNIKRVQALAAQGLMTPAGEKAFAQRDASRSPRYSFEQRNVDMPAGYLQQLKRNRKAWTFWQAQPPFYRRTITWWVTSAKQEETRQRRLQRLISASAAGERVGMLKKKNG